jgi:hypothetical protein
MEQTKRISGHGPRVLPRIQIGAGIYFADLWVRQFRRADGPLDFVDFESEAGKAMCEQANIVCCPACKMSVLVPGPLRDEELRCMACLSRLGPR